MAQKTLICLHGFTHNGKFFEKLAQNLTSFGWAVGCPSFFGRGDQHKLPSNEYNYETYVNYLEKITENLKDFSLLGSSMGGLTAMIYIDRHPKRVKKLILNDVGSFISSDAIKKVGAHITSKVEFGSNEELTSKIKAEFLESNLNNYEIEYLESIYTENNRIKYDPEISKAFWKGEKQRRIPDLDYTEMWNRIIKNNPNMEILIIRGDKSEFLTKETAISMQKSDKVNLMEVKNTGHLPLLFKNHEIEIVSNFLS